MSTDDYLTMDVSSNRSHLGAKSSHFQAKIKSHTSLVFTVALIKNTECTEFPLKNAFHVSGIGCIRIFSVTELLACCQQNVVYNLMVHPVYQIRHQIGY